jgi:hypothetical protein
LRIQPGIEMPGYYHHVAPRRANAKSPKRPTQNDFGGGVRPNGTTGNQLRSSGRESAPAKKTARKIMSRFTSAATFYIRPVGTT